MPDISLPEVFLPILEKKKRFKVMISGRGGGKSMSVADILIIKAKTEGLKILACREFQSSLSESVHSLVRSEIERLGVQGFEITNNEIRTDTGGLFIFMGLARNPHSIKSLHGVNIAWIEEAATLSAESLQMLTPSIREKDSEIWFTANPQSREDAFSERFINPYQDELDKYGYYEDEDHLIIKSGYKDNPFFPEVLKQEMALDKKIMSNALWNYTWAGDFFDDIENALISEEWFSACVDAHVKLGFKPTGAKICAYDPADSIDAKAFAYRHGSVFLDVQETQQGDANSATDWAIDLALQHQCNYFTFDGSGLGVSLNRQISEGFNQKTVRVVMFKGGEGVDNPDAIYQPSMKAVVIDQKTNKDSFRNKRVQSYCMLRDRVYRTYRAVVHGEYHDPDELISFSSGIKDLSKLKSELCRLPIKHNQNGKIDLYTKPEMKTKFKLKSQNLADSVSMAMMYRSIHKPAAYIPRPMRTMGAR